MFTARLHIGSSRPLPGLTQPAASPIGRLFQGGGILRLVASLGFLALGLPSVSSAQALGTMQVAARVIPASVGWTGLAEARLVARSASGRQPGLVLIRRGRLVHASAEIHPSSGHPGGSRLLIVTLQHPHN
jgi:hypothetical protein